MVLFLAICLLFLILNRGAYQGFFQDDELGNLSWQPFVSARAYLTGLVTPQFLADNFRPVGHAYFALGGRAFGLHFPPYVAMLQGLHLLTTFLLLLLARELKIPWHGALFAAAFFALNVAIFDAVWKPMYVFDVLCGLWSVASLLFYARCRWVLSFVCFWLAYKSKELAVMLPAVLALYEYLLGERRWPRLIPFFAVSLSFGLQGLLLNPNRDNDYTFRFTLAALRKTVPFYSSRVLLAPYAGLAFLTLPFLTRDRRVWWGAAACAALFLPLLFLPGRLFAAYCYVPLTAAALAAGAFAAHFRAVWLLPLLAIWVPWNIRELRIDRRATLAADDEARAYVRQLQHFGRTHRQPPPIVYENVPLHFAHWGVEAAVNIVYHRMDLEPYPVDSPHSAALWGREPLSYLYWNAPNQQLYVFDQSARTPLPAFLELKDSRDHRALLGGWFGLSQIWRWSEPQAAVRLNQPPSASRFELTVNVPAAQIRANQHVHLAVRLNYAPLGEADFTTAGYHTVSWSAPRGSGATRIDLTADPPYATAGETRPYGVALVALGFVPGKAGGP